MVCIAITGVFLMFGFDDNNSISNALNRTETPTMESGTRLHDVHDEISYNGTDQMQLKGANRREDSEKRFDFRSFLSFLEEHGDLVRIKKEVDPKYELPAILWKFQPQKKAVLFEKVKGSNVPAVGGLMQGIAKLGLALGVPVTKKFVNLEETEFLNAALANPIPYKTVDKGPVKEVIKIGSEIDISLFPVPTFFEEDSGPFITGGVGIARNPETGALNAGIYRILVIGKDTITVNASGDSDLAHIYRTAEKRGEELSIAVAIGVDPALLFAATKKTPRSVSEFDVAGALKGEPIKVVKCETSDLPIPANAEIVIEGKVDFSKKVSNKLGEAAGYYGSNINPMTRITAVTHRHDAIFYTVLAGRSVEHRTLGAFNLNSKVKPFIQEIMKKHPIIKKAHSVVIGTMLHFIISIEKKSDEEPMELIKEIFQTTVGPIPVSQFIKRIVVVDDDIDIYDQNDVEWAVWSRVGDAGKIFILPDVVSFETDLAAKDGKSVRVGIDATKDLDDSEKLKRAIIPGLEEINIQDYLQ
jgi:2,5-furandicarboxylate decarboxylase 1